MVPESDQKIMPIQALRFIAALAVALGHAEIFSYWLVRTKGVPAERWEWFGIGAAGVDLFFVISGFVMVYSARRLIGQPGARKQFLTRRVIRIVPLYWLATLVLAAWFWRWGEAPGLASVGQSLAFLPYPNPAADGRMVPVLEVGWTLNFEMLFYLAFGLALAGSIRATAFRTGLLFGLLVTFGFAFSPTGPAGFWTAPIILEFAAGMAIGLVYLNGAVLTSLVRFSLAAFALIWLAWFGLPDDLYGLSRLLHYGPPAITLLAAVVLGPVRLPLERFWARGGDISYALYLWHLPLMIVVQVVWWHFALPVNGFARIGFTCLTVLGSIAAANLIYRYFEVPVSSWLKSAFLSGTR